MPKLPVVSGQKAIKALSKLGFSAVRQRGSHIVMTGKGRTFAVPVHPELDRGTLRAILREAGVSVQEFLDVL
jgi:predicted RNA binding protein YcfA (HicA-like mRNA interferase family)